MADLYVCLHGQTRPCSQCDLPTDAEAEAILCGYGTSGKEVVNGFIDHVLRERLQFEDAVKTFVRNRGKHEGKHIFDLTVCRLCDESYICAEAELDSVLDTAPTTITPSNAARERAWQLVESVLNEHRECYVSNAALLELVARIAAALQPTEATPAGVEAAAREIVSFFKRQQNLPWDEASYVDIVKGLIAEGVEAERSSDADN